MSKTECFRIHTTSFADVASQVCTTNATITIIFIKSDAMNDTN